jgi:hypothetical protein
MYRLIRFGQTNLEYRNQIDTVGNGTAVTGYLPLPGGGAFDFYGSDVAPTEVIERVKRIRLQASSEAALQQIFLTFLTLRGKRDKLYRRLKTGEIQWTWARLVEVVAERSYEQSIFKWIQDIELRFNCVGAWNGYNHGENWLLDSGEYLDSNLVLDAELGFSFTLNASPKNIVIANAGNTVVKNIRLRLHVGSVALTSVTFTVSGQSQFTWSGNAGAGKDLVIDCGAQAVTLDGADAYSGFSFGGSHVIDDWLRFGPGNTTLTVAFVGGGVNSQLVTTFNDTWE